MSLIAYLPWKVGRVSRLEWAGMEWAGMEWAAVEWAGMERKNEHSKAISFFFFFSFLSLSIGNSTF